MNCYNNHICTYFTLSTWKEKELKIWQNTRQTDNNHPRQYLIWKDKIRHRSKHTLITMTDQRPHTHWRWHHQAPEHEHTKRTVRMEDWAPHTEAQTNTEQQDEPQDKLWPCIPRKRQRHVPNQMCIHMTHRTSTSMHFTSFHCNYFTSLTSTEDLLDGHRYWPGYLTAGKYPHLFHFPTMAV